MEVIREGGGLNKGEQSSWGKTMAEVWRVIQQVQRTEAGEAQVHGGLLHKEDFKWDSDVIKFGFERIYSSGYISLLRLPWQSGSLSQSGWFKQQNLFSRSPAGWNLRSRLWQVWFLLRLLSLLCRWPPTCCVLLRYFVSGLYIPSVFFFSYEDTGCIRWGPLPLWPRLIIN